MVDSTELSERLAKQLQESQTLFEISRTLAETIELNTILQQIAHAANQLIKSANQTILHLLNCDSTCLNAVAISGENRPKNDRAFNFKMGEGIAGTVLSTGRTINVPDVLHDSRFLPEQPDTTPQIRSLLVAPVRTGEKSLGTLSVQSRTVSAFTPDDERLLTILGAQAAVAIEKAKLYSDLQSALDHEKSIRAQLVQSEKLASLGRIIASVAHELNNPLQTIQNALYLIKSEELLSSQACQDLQTALMETERMAVIISRLREIYRPVNREEFQSGSINLLILEVQRLLDTHLKRNCVSFELNPDPEMPEFPMIRDQIKQVILNICLNAIEAMPDGGHIRVVTNYLSDKRMAEITISDTGLSINPVILPYIFDPFVTTKEGGTGLGLAITYEIIQRHRGKIDVNSVAGKGTTFTVDLPVS